MHDVLGRVATEVYLDGGGFGQALLFSPATGAVLAEEGLSGSGPGCPPLWASAVLATGYVRSLGQELPGAPSTAEPARSTLRTRMPGAGPGDAVMAASMIRLAAGIVAGTLVMTAGAAVAASAAPAITGAAAAAPQQRSAAGRTVLLLNGDHVAQLPGPGGRPVSALVPVPGAGGVHGLSLGAHQYYFPADALPFLGRGLSLSLFSLADLGRAEKDGRLPVAITFTGRRPPLPGVTITRAGSPRRPDT